MKNFSHFMKALLDQSYKVVEEAKKTYEQNEKELKRYGYLPSHLIGEEWEHPGQAFYINDEWVNIIYKELFKINDSILGFVIKVSFTFAGHTMSVYLTTLDDRTEIESRFKTEAFRKLKEMEDYCELWKNEVSMFWPYKPNSKV